MVDYTDVMDVRRATYWAAIRLAVVFSTVATVVALGLETVGDVSPTVLVLTVIVVGFTISWRRTGHVASQRVAAQTAHRIARVPIRTAPVRTHLA